MNEKDNSAVNKPQIAFIVLFAAIAFINFISMIYDDDGFAGGGTARVVSMSVMTLISIFITAALLALYFSRISHMENLKTRYLIVSLCCVIICTATVLRGSFYMRDLAEGTSVAVTDKYWYYMGSGDIKFTDSNGSVQVVRVKNSLGEMTLPLITSQFFPSDDSEQNKKSIYIEYYPHSRTLKDIHFV